MNAESSLRASRRSLLACVGVVILILPFESVIAENTPRTWTDSTGQFSVRATLLGMENGRVTLLRTTGEAFRVPLLRLSTADRRYATLEARRTIAADHSPEAKTPQHRSGPPTVNINSREFSGLIPTAVGVARSMNHPVRKDDRPGPTDRLEYQPLLQHFLEAELSSRLARDTPQLDLFRSDEDARRLIACLDEQSQPGEDRRTRSGRLKRVPKRHVLIRRNLVNRPELSGLPMLNGAECRLSMDECKSLRKVSSKFDAERSQLNLHHPIVVNASLNLAPQSRHLVFSEREQQRLDERNREYVSIIRRQREWYDERAVPALVQILQPEARELRRELIEILGRIDSPRASIALAKRAVFDLSAENRAAATEALGTRPAAEYRKVFIDTFRFPWPPAAQHAAEALIRLDDQAARDDLTVLLDEPNPLAPYHTADGKFAVRELVRINHLRNCLLCHAGSTDETHLVRGQIPYPDRRLPRQYGGSRSRSSGSFVRADITYLRQDFSVSHPVADHQPWPYIQRFDYLVRTRSLSPEEAAQHRHQISTTPNPHRDAVLFALRMLSDKENVSPHEMLADQSRDQPFLKDNR